MRLMTTTICVLAGLVLGMIGARANVIYNWQPIDNPTQFSLTGGQLVFTDAAYLAGHIHVELDNTNDYEPDYTYPNSPLLRSHMLINISAIPGRTDNVDIYPRQTPSYRRIFFIDDDITFGPDGFLSGTSYNNAFDFTYDMHSVVDGIWTASFVSDNDATGCFEQSCVGATGRWILDASTIPVPAPAGLYLVGFGLLGLLAMAQRRERKL